MKTTKYYKLELTENEFLLLEAVLNYVGYVLSAAERFCDEDIEKCRQMYCILEEAKKPGII